MNVPVAVAAVLSTMVRAPQVESTVDQRIDQAVGHPEEENARLEIFAHLEDNTLHFA